MTNYLVSRLWDKLPQRRWQRCLVYAGRLLYRLVADIEHKQITLHAMGLVFTTLLAIVPLLAVSFSVLKGFGVHNQFEPLLLQFLQPLGSQGEEITNRIIGFVDNVRVGILGSLGLVLLFYSALSLIQKVESAFNSIWYLQQNRTLLRRLADYLSVMIIGPVLIFAAMGLSASLANHELAQQVMLIKPIGSTVQLLLKAIPYLLIILAFTFFYIFIPNTRVSWRAAFLGAIVSGLVWQSVGWGFAATVVASTRYTAIYSGFAVLILLMLWIYLNWLILLVGANLVYYLQYPELLDQSQQKTDLNIATTEQMAFAVLCLIGRAFYQGQHGLTEPQIAQSLPITAPQTRLILDLLQQIELIDCSESQPENFIPIVPLDTLTVTAVMQRIRGNDLELPDAITLQVSCWHDYAVMQRQIMQDVTVKSCLGLNSK